MGRVHRRACTAALGAALAACSSYPNGPDTSLVSRGKVVADRENFPRVADAIQPSCGTLDCHGHVARNWRVYGGRGLRINEDANPSDGETTETEYEASYRSTVLLEPDAISAVLADDGENPERLSLIRKARGHERHKGGTQMMEGDSLDRCLTSWLQNKTDVDACMNVSDAPRPEIP